MKENLLIIALFLLLTFSLYSQNPPDTLWTKTFGGDYGELAFSIEQTLDGGFLLSGITQSQGAGNDDFWLIKTDLNGDSLWSKTFGGSESDIAYSSIITNDNGYAIAGETNSFGSGRGDYWLIKTDSFGDSLWSKTFSGLDDDHCHSVIQTSDNGFMLAGYSSVYGTNEIDVLIIKTNSSGDSLWSQYYGGSGRDICYEISETSDHGFIMTGWSDSFSSGNNELYLIRTNSLGDTLWTRTYNNCIRGNSVQETYDGNFIITGESQDNRLILMKVDSGGYVIWSNNYEYSSAGYSVKETLDAGYIFCGEHSNPDIGYIVKTNSLGDEQWNISLGGDLEDDRFNCVYQSNDGNYIVAGFARSHNSDANRDFWLVKTDSDNPLPVELSSFTAVQTSENLAQINWTTQSESELLGYNIYRNVTENIVNSIIINPVLIPSTNSFSPHDYSFIDEDVEYDQFYYYWLESLEIDSSSELFGPVSLTLINPENEMIDLPNATVLNSAYPNPFNPKTTISFDIKEGETGILTIFNVKGQKVISKSFIAGTHEFKWIADNNTSGVYFYKLQTASYSKINKVLMLK